MLGALLLLVAPAFASDAFHHHAFKPGETVGYDFEDTDTVFAAVPRDGTLQAGEALQVKEIREPVTIAIGDGKRRLTILPAASYRAAAPGTLEKMEFAAVTKLSKNVPPDFTYEYKDDHEALTRLQKIFESVRKDEVGSFLFFKTQDIHQMQGSVENIPEGMTPGQEHAQPRHDVGGLGGKFSAAPERLIYQGTETFDGVRCGYFKSISLGHEFSMPKLKTYTNFSYSLHVALEGPSAGLMLFGEGQETATVLTEDAKGKLQPAALLQRQFSIRLRPEL